MRPFRAVLVIRTFKDKGFSLFPAPPTQRSDLAQFSSLLTALEKSPLTGLGAPGSSTKMVTSVPPSLEHRLRSGFDCLKLGCNYFSQDF